MKTAEQDFPCFLVGITDHPKAQKKTAKVVFFVFDCVVFASDALGFLCRLAQKGDEGGIGGKLCRTWHLGKPREADLFLVHLKGDAFDAKCMLDDAFF